MHNDQGQSQFQLREHLNRAQIGFLNNSTASTSETASTESSTNLDDSLDDLVDSNGEVEFDLLQDRHAIPSSTANLPTITRKLRAQFGWRHTHNEQLFVAPCGIIVARKTFYHSEAPSEVVVCVSTFYSLSIKNNIEVYLGDD